MDMNGVGMTNQSRRRAIYTHDAQTDTIFSYRISLYLKRAPLPSLTDPKVIRSPTHPPTHLPLTTFLLICLPSYRVKTA